MRLIVGLLLAVSTTAVCDERLDCYDAKDDCELHEALCNAVLPEGFHDQEVDDALVMVDEMWTAFTMQDEDFVTDNYEWALYAMSLLDSLTLGLGNAQVIADDAQYRYDTVAMPAFELAEAFYLDDWDLTVPDWTTPRVEFLLIGLMREQVRHKMETQLLDDGTLYPWLDEQDRPAESFNAGMDYLTQLCWALGNGLDPDYFL